LSDILSQANTARGWNIFDTNITLYGSNVSIGFEQNTCIEAVQRVVENTNYYLDFRPDGTVVFDSFNTSNADHSLTFQKHIVEYNKDIDGIDIANDISLQWDSGTVSDTDATSQTTYGVLSKIIVDSSIKDVTTANNRLAIELADNKIPKEKVKLAVNSSYDIANINV
jgi:hypothetical protein